MKPNLLFITCHDLGRHLGCLGQQTVQSPSLDALAADGVCFNQAYCTSPLCSPSRASIHTGMWAHSTGINGLTHGHFGWRLGAQARHMASHLRANGYQSAELIGFQHLTADSYELGYSSADFKLAAASDIAAQAAARLRSRPAEPFYLEVGFFETHRPFEWGGAQPDRTLGVDVPGYLPETSAIQADTAALQGAVRQLDAGVGQVLTALRDAGLEQNTLVVFTTDHGLPMVRAKSTLYDAGLGVALLMRWPGGGLIGGRHLDAMMSQVDIFPTLCDALSVPLPAEVQGVSFWPYVHANAPAPRTEIFAEKTYHTAYEPMRAIRTATHKLIVNFEVGPAIDVPTDIQIADGYSETLSMTTPVREPVELYDLTGDPGEWTNLANDAACATVREELFRKLVAWMVETKDPLLQGPVPSPYAGKVRALLGLAS